MKILVKGFLTIFFKIIITWLQSHGRQDSKFFNSTITFLSNMIRKIIKLKMF